MLFVLKINTFLEMSPGTEILQKILEKDPSNVLVIEKDNDLVKLLKDKFETNIEIINKDVLKDQEKTH